MTYWFMAELMIGNDRNFKNVLQINTRKFRTVVNPQPFFGQVFTDDYVNPANEKVMAARDKQNRTGEDTWNSNYLAMFISNITETV